MSFFHRKVHRLFPLAAALGLAFLGISACSNDTSTNNSTTLDPRTRTPTSGSTVPATGCQSIAVMPSIQVSGPTAIPARRCSGPYLALFQGASGVCDGVTSETGTGTPVTVDTVLYLNSSRPSIRYYTDASCHHPAPAMLVRTGQIGARFYVVDFQSVYGASVNASLDVDAGDTSGSQIWSEGTLPIQIQSGW